MPKLFSANFLSEHSVPDWVKPPFVIFDVLALWRSGLSARAPGCQKCIQAGPKISHYQIIKKSLYID